MVKRWGRLLGRRAAATIIEEHGGDGSGDAVGAFKKFALAASSSPWVELIGILLGVGTGWYLRERDLRAERERQEERRRLDRRGRLIAASPAASLVTARDAAADGILVDDDGDGGVEEHVLGDGDGAGAKGRGAGLRRTALSERLARGIPVLGAAWLWQLLSKIDGPPSLLDPLAAVLSWFFLELLMVSVPRGVWNAWDIGNRGATVVASQAAAGKGVPRLTMPGSVPEGVERKGQGEDAVISVPLGAGRARAGGAPPPTLEVGSLPPSGGGGGGPRLSGVGSAGVAPPAAAVAFEEVAPTTLHGAAAMSEPGPHSSGRRRRGAPGAASAKDGATAARGGGATAAATIEIPWIWQGLGSEGTRNGGEAAALAAGTSTGSAGATAPATAVTTTTTTTRTRSQREKKRVLVADASVAAAATAAAPAAASPATPVAGPSPPPPAARESAARRTTNKRRPRTATSAATAAATTPASSSGVTVGPTPSTAGSARSAGIHATPPHRPPGSSRGSGKKAPPSGGYNSLSEMRRFKRRYPGSNRGGVGGGASPACESPAAKRAMVMKTRRLSSGSGPRGSGVGVGLGVFGGGFGDGLDDFEYGAEERERHQRSHQHQHQSRHSQLQGRQRPPHGQDAGGREVLRDPNQGQPATPEIQVQHKRSSESDAAATAGAAVSNGTPTPTATTAGHGARVAPRHAAPTCCSSYSCSTSSTAATKEASSTSSSEASPAATAAAAAAAAAATPKLKPAEAIETGLGGEESSRRMPVDPTRASQGQGAPAEAGAESESCAGSAGPEGWERRKTLVALYERDAAGSREAGERGTPVPPELRPREREGDVLCEWSLEQLRVDGEVGMFSCGTFGKVLAVRTQMEQQLAVKIVAKSGFSQDRYIERELELLEACSVHPNVVGLHGVIRTSARVYVLMPLADTDLAAMVKDTVLDEKQASFCVRQVLGAVEFLHKRSIVHRDIKPANILVLSNKVLLADFGLAKQLPKGQPGLLVGACGTKPYLAPELVRDVPYDAAVDLWAVGVVTYELLHGYTPFSPKLVVPRSWNGVVREGKHSSSPAAENHSDSNTANYNPEEIIISSSSSRRRSIVNASFSVSVSESSGSIVNKRMFERSAPPAPGGSLGMGLDRAWLAGQAHQALLFGKGGENDEYQAEIRTGDVSGKGVRGGGGGGGGGAGGWGGVADAGGRRRGHREADQLKLLDAIVRGVYEVEESCVGEVGVDFIAKLLHVSPARRMSALLASEHPFLGPPARAPARRRLARAEVAANIAERASCAAERHRARIEQQQQEIQRDAGTEGPCGHNNDNPLSDIAQLCAAMAAEARSLVVDVKRWNKEATAAAEEEEEQEHATGGGGGGGGGEKAGETAGRAESVVRRAELLASEARAGSVAAKAVADAREYERMQEEAAEAEAAAVRGSQTVGVGVARATGASNGDGKGTIIGNGPGNGTAGTLRD
eukprot:g12858.t1